MTRSETDPCRSRGGSSFHLIHLPVKDLSNGVVFQGARLYVRDYGLDEPPYRQAIASMFLERGVDKPIPVDEFPSSDSDNTELFMQIGFLLNERKLEFVVDSGRPCLRLTMLGVEYAERIDSLICARIREQLDVRRISG